MTSHSLISPEELAARLDEVSVLDVRWSLGGPSGREAFEAGHIPGAVYVDLERDLADPPGAEGRHPLPEASRFAAAMRHAGVSQARPVVVCDDWQGRAAARGWWLLRFHGHRDVRVLDGGWSAWREAGLPIEQGERAVPAGDFQASEGATMAVVQAGDVLDAEVLIDARAPERFSGAVEPADPVAGHIPGARNVPTTVNVGADGRFRGRGELAAAYAEAGAVAGAGVVVYCGSGVTAAHDVLALEIAGVPAALYPGSWSGWITDPTRPIDTSGS